MRKASPILLVVLIVLTVGGIFWTQDLKQANKETIFLTAESQREYLAFKEDFNIRSLVVGKLDSYNRETTLAVLQEKCGEVCEVVDKTSLPPNDRIKLQQGNEEAIILIQKEESSETEFKRTLKVILETDSGKIMDFSGVPYTNILLDEYSKKVKTVIFPSLFAGVFILLLLYLRSLKYAVVVFLPGLMAASLSLASTKLFLGKSNLITSIIPLLLFVIQMSLVLHIHFTGRELKSLMKGLIDKKEPIFLMVFTTFIGFGSLYFSELQAISHFGVMTAFLLLGTTLFSCLWLYLLALSFEKWWDQEAAQARFPLQENLKNYWSLKVIGLFSLVVLTLGSYSLTKITVVTDATQYFPSKTKIREKMITLSEKFLGSPLVEIIVPYTEGENTFNNLEKIFKKEKILANELPGLTLSSNQLVLIGNEAYTGEEKLPSNKFAYFAIRSKIPQALIEGYPLDSDEVEGYRLTYLGAPMNVDKYENLLETIKKVFGDKIHFNGLYYHLMMAQKKMIGTLFKSFFLSLVLISLIAFLYFKKIKLFFIFMAVNILPVFASFPLLWLFDLSFNIATVMVYSISLGLVVDSSFHIIHTMNDKSKDREFLVKSVLQPIVGASALLSVCFFFFSLIDFLPIREFGLSLGIVILIGMLLDLKALPSLYS